MDLIKLSLDNYNVILYIDKIIYILFFIFVLITFFVRRKFSLQHKIQISEASIGIGDAKITIKTNHQVQQIAYKLWVELNTRKSGLPIDLDNDVIVEIYNSWYKFFEITRELI